MKAPTRLVSISRRSLLQNAGGAVVLLGAGACDKAPSFCNDVSSLSGDQQGQRTALGYEDTTSQPGKTCAKCSQYVPPAKASECGHCKILPGIVHPNGYCRAYTPRA